MEYFLVFIQLGKIQGQLTAKVYARIDTQVTSIAQKNRDAN